MIHVDIEEEFLEFEGSGETMLKEMALVMTMSLIESVNDGVLPIDAVPYVVDNSLEMLGAVVKDAVEMGVNEHEEEEVPEERSSEEIRTVIKQYRRARPS